jgi:hypothetical protein
MAINCGQTTIPTTDETPLPCDDFRSTRCTLHGPAIPFFGLEENTPLDEIIDTLVLSLQNFNNVNYALSLNGSELSLNKDGNPISSIDLGGIGGGPGFTPPFQQVTDEGAVTTNGITVNSLSTTNNFATIQEEDIFGTDVGSLKLANSSSPISLEFYGTGTFRFLQGTNFLEIGTLGIPGQHQVNFQPKNGVVAYLDDIPEDDVLALSSTLNSDTDAILAHLDGMNEVDSVVDVTITVQPVSTINLPVNTLISYIQVAGGNIIIDYGPGVIGDSVKSYNEGDVVTLWHKSTNRWVAINPPTPLITLTQAEFDAIPVKDPKAFYFII